MNICLEESYINNLEKYIGRKLNIIEKENRMEVIYDAEIQYVLRRNDINHYSFYLVQRNQSSEIAEYYSELEMKRKFSIAMKEIFGEKIDYSKTDEFEKAENLAEVENLMNLYVGQEYYSIKKPQKKKINLELTEEKKYSIYFLKENDKRNYIERNLKAPFAFCRFYNEALFLKMSIEKINEYQMIFADKMEDEEIYDMLDS